MPPHQVRIIAGSWRGRRLPVLDLPGLRPTGDRVRETLFNWLTPAVIGTKCLDLFAGSGALGMEALSRGASSVVFVDQSRPAMASLVASTETWPGIERAEFVVADVNHWLAGPGGEFDLVFLDPPFEDHLASASLESVIVGNWIRPGGLIYVESAKGEGPDWSKWAGSIEVERQKAMGQVEVSLVRYHNPPMP